MLTARCMGHSRRHSMAFDDGRSMAADGQRKPSMATEDNPVTIRRHSSVNPSPMPIATRSSFACLYRLFTPEARVPATRAGWLRPGRLQMRTTSHSTPAHMRSACLSCGNAAPRPPGLPPRQSTEINGNRQQSMTIDGNRQQSMPIEGNRRQSTAIDGNRRQSTEADGSRRQLTALGRHPPVLPSLSSTLLHAWSSMGPSGAPCTRAFCALAVNTSYEGRSLSSAVRQTASRRPSSGHHLWPSDGEQAAIRRPSPARR